MSKVKPARRRSTKKRAARVRVNHPLVGTWVQVENAFHTSSAVFTIAVQGGRFLVSGVDESDGAAFKISGTSWDGKQLQFVSFFPPTKHEAKHAFRVLRNGKAKHHVSFTDEDGRFSDDEL